MIKFIDYAAFSAANFIFGMAMARIGGANAIAGFSYSVSIALIFNGLFKSIVVNPFSLAPEGVVNRYVAATYIYGFFCIAGFSVYALYKFIFADGFGSGDLFFPLCLWFLIIDFSRMFFLKNKSELKSSVFSILFFCFSFFSLLANQVIGEGVFVFVFCFVSFVVFLLFCVCFRFNYSLFFGVLLIKNGFRRFTVYWIANSGAVHFPAILIAKINAEVAASFYILRTIYNGFSIFFRPVENRYRLTLGLSKSPVKKFKEFYLVVLGVILALSVSLFFVLDYLIEYLWPNIKQIDLNSLVCFFVYMGLMWFFIFAEPLFLTEKSRVLVLSLTKIGECFLIVFLLGLPLLLDFEIDFVEFIFLVNFPMVISAGVLMFFIWHSSGGNSS